MSPVEHDAMASQSPAELTAGEAAQSASVENAPKSARGALRCFRLTLAYDGTNYFGWQRQPNHPSVQAAVEAALCAMTGESSVRLLASSRTDTGVHALGQSAVFTTRAWSAAAERIPLAINSRLPNDIVVREAVEVKLNFNPLRENTGKRYRYQVYSARKPDPIGTRTHWWVPRRLNPAQMREAARLLVGEHDFASFQTSGSPRSSTIREVRELTIAASPHMDGTLFQIEVEASGFLYNMVRNIVGTLVQVGLGRNRPEWVLEVLAAKDRRIAGQTAPANGLFLLEVKY